MTGTTGYVNQELVSTYLPAAALGDKAKIFVCGRCLYLRAAMYVLTILRRPSRTGSRDLWPEEGLPARRARWYPQAARLHGGAGASDTDIPLYSRADCCSQVFKF